MKYKVNIEVEGDETLKGIKIDFVGQTSKVTYLPIESTQEDSKTESSIPKSPKRSNVMKSSKVKEVKEQPIPPEMNEEF